MTAISSTVTRTPVRPPVLASERAVFERGSVFIELLWTLPAFAAGLGLIIFIGVQINARSALQDAVSHGLSLGVSRANGIEGATGSIEVINALIHDPKDLALRAAVARLLVSDENKAWFESSEQLEVNLKSGYSHTSFSFTDSNRIKAQPVLQDHPSPSQLYALSYISQAMELNTLGDAVFPCTSPGNTPLAPGCLSCRFFAGSEAGTFLAGLTDDSQFTSAIFVDITDPILLAINPPDSPRRDEVAKERLSVICRYRPKNLFVDLLISLAQSIGLRGTGFGIVTAIAAVDNR